MNRVRLTGLVPVALPPEQAFELFTASGERAWAEGWEPVFPVPASSETEPGTVFETRHGHETTTWVVAASSPGRAITYARLAPGDRAGLVEVVCEPAAGGTTNARVTYDLTPLSEHGGHALEHFAAGFDGFLDGWRDAIARAT